MILLDAAPVSGGVAIVAGAIFFAALAATAFVVFKLLRKTVKMAFRVAIVAVILLIAIIGTISFWWLGTSNPHPRPPVRPHPTQPR